MLKVKSPDNEEICIGCYCEVKLIVRLPQGDVTPIVELFAPEAEGATVEGYIRNLSLGKIGRLLPADLKMTQQTLKEDAGQLPLLTLYTRSGENNEILNAKVYFGVIFNGKNTANDYAVTVRVTIKALHPKGAIPGDEITITVTPHWSTGTGLAKSTSVSLRAVTTIEDPSQLDSVYAHCPAGETDLNITMFVVFSNKVAGTVPVICALTVNGKQSTNDNLIEFLAYRQPAELSADKIPTVNIKQANFGSSNFYNTGVNLILASLSILPGAKQNYNLRATTVPSDGSTLYCRPRMTSFSSLIGTIKEPQQVDRGTSVELPLGNLNYEMASAEMSASFDTLNYLIPVTITSVAGTTASVTVVLTHGSTEVTTAVNPVLQDATIRLGVFARPWMEGPNANSLSHRTEVSLNIRMDEGRTFDANSIKTIIFTVDPTKSTVERLAPYAQSPTISFTTTVPAEGKPGEIKELNLLVSVPPASTLPESSVHIECPVQSGEVEAGCTVIGYRISSGFNLAGMANGRYTPTFSSTSPSNQLNKMNIPLGTVVNTGASQSLGLSITDVDLLSMTVQFRIADGKNSVNSAELPVKATVKLGSFNGDASTKLKVKRDGTEEMQIDLTSTVADVKSSYLPGDNVTLVVSLSMKSTSRLECQSRSMLIHHSVFYENAKIIDQNSSAYQFIEDASGTDSRVTKFTAGPLYFDQTVVVKLLLHVKDDLTFPDGESYKEATITTELICMAYERTSVAQGKLGGPPAMFFAFTRSS
ncbi:hypothetical protein FGIG_09148 [Fasciola gigantica]|uniref:Uncharacterized protein n=1 Tax=Fasciola gigantica TaxID=46835 RepID=A0A504YT32_FASGI|nr:hypothetical protein FGIG_09148 [Fasciola gigantica]